MDKKQKSFFRKNVEYAIVMEAASIVSCFEGFFMNSQYWYGAASGIAISGLALLYMSYMDQRESYRVMVSKVKKV